MIDEINAFFKIKYEYLMNELMKSKDALDIIGFSGPFILMFISISYLWNQKYLQGYLIFYIISSFINKILKNIIQEERPVNGKSIMNENYTGKHKYGMPSYHAQLSFYSLTFLYLVNKSGYLIFFELFIAALTLYQRWSYKRHTVEQLIVGMVVGVMTAYIGYYATSRYLITNKSIQ
jgi:membrane-associated phospholipid phosphatase